MANIPKVWNGTAFIELEAAATVAPAASTTVVGIVQLTDSTSSTSTTTAATPNSVKSAYDLAGTAIPKNTVTAAGDILYASGSATPARLAIGTASQVLSVVGGLPSWTTLAAAGADVQEFTSSGSWVKPAGKSAVYVFAIGGGGGGASGGRASSSYARGGGGGYGAAHSASWFPASTLPGTVTVTIGNGGAGGTAIASGTTSVEGVLGADGGDTTFGTIIRAIGGPAGKAYDGTNSLRTPQGIVEYGRSDSNGAPGTAGTSDANGTAIANIQAAASFSEYTDVGRTSNAPRTSVRAMTRTASGGSGGMALASGTTLTDHYGGNAGARGFGADGTVPSGGNVVLGGGTATAGSAGSVVGSGFGHGGGGGGAAFSGIPGAGGAGYRGGGGGGGGGVAVPAGSAARATGAGGVGGDGYVIVISI